MPPRKLQERAGPVKTNFVHLIRFQVFNTCHGKKNQNKPTKNNWTKLMAPLVKKKLGSVQNGPPSLSITDPTHHCPSLSTTEVTQPFDLSYISVILVSMTDICHWQCILSVMIQLAFFRSLYFKF